MGLVVDFGNNAGLIVARRLRLARAAGLLKAATAIDGVEVGAGEAMVCRADRWRG
jgi:hypothetical protein